jgi:hypothetical protein
MRTDEELKQVARDWVENRIFMSTQVKNPADIPMVFMVLAMADEELIDQYKKEDVVAFYEYYEKASPRSINGYPTFFSAHNLTRDEFEKVRTWALEAQQALEKVLGKPKCPSNSG